MTEEIVEPTEPTTPVVVEEPVVSDGLKEILDEITQLKAANEALKADNEKLKLTEGAQLDLLKKYIMGRVAAPSVPALELNLVQSSAPKVPEDYFTRPLDLS